MKSYSVEFTTAAAKELRKLDGSLRRRILAAIMELAVAPRPPGCKKLVGESTAWRIRVGDYRVIYDLIDDALIITVVRVAHRHEVYR